MQKPSVNSIKKKIKQMGQSYAPGNASKPGHLYNPIPFKEFENIPSQREAVYERWKMIKPHLYGSTALDVGCHTGFNCYMLHREGFECTGVEAHTLTTEIAQDVNEHFELGIKFINSEITPELCDELGKFDVCFFLSTFQWVTKAHGFEYAKKLLYKLICNSKVLFFETSMGNEGKAKMPMIKDVTAVFNMLVELKPDGRKVECLGAVIPPGGSGHPKRYIFKVC